MLISPNPVNWFEIPVTDIARAKTFYESAFGAEFTDMDMGPVKMAMFPAEIGASGATGTLIQPEGYVPSHAGTVVYIHVPQIDAALTKIGDAGGKTLMPRIGVGMHGFVAQFEDSEGNRVALHESAAG